MSNSYQPESFELYWMQQWLKTNHNNPNKTADSFCMMLPPPNITGRLHMGHAFQQTLMDFLSRYQRMHGAKVLWQPGIDHASIATQMMVEKQLQRQGTSRQQLGRQKFIDKVWLWKEDAEEAIVAQMQRLGMTVDWSSHCFTMDPKLSQAVKFAFKRLYQDQLIYRGEKMIHWDPQLQTAVSDLEINHSEELGELCTIRYFNRDKTNQLLVATTRPETLFADQAIAVHPDDPRYQHWIGQDVILPLTGRTIQVIADSYVDPDFGSGCLKITPAHDFNDYQVAGRHQLTILNILDERGCFNHNVPMKLRGLPAQQQRATVVEMLKQQDYLEATMPYRHVVPRGERSGVILEPRLTTQWFMRMKPLAQKAIIAAEAGQLHFIPEHWLKTYLYWLNNIEDWCISRQLWWGHPIPAWHDDQGQIYVGDDEASIRKEHKLDDKVCLQPDPDVLDTWFSSALWPFSTLGWPEKTAKLASFYPNQVLITGFDIIFFWVARMVMMGLYFLDKVPFEQIYIHGLIRDEHGQKMSKTKGNVLDPLDLVAGIDVEQLVNKRCTDIIDPKKRQQLEKKTRQQFPQGIPAYGTCPLRMTFLSLAVHGRDVQFDFDRLQGWRFFCNKLWQASRFVLQQAKTIHGEEAEQYLATYRKMIELKPEKTWTIERWWLHELASTTNTLATHIQQFRFDQYANQMHQLVWHHFCDWLLESSKPILQQGNDRAKFRLQLLIQGVLHLLTILHPAIPFITEEIQALFFPEERGQQLLMQASWPKLAFEDHSAQLLVTEFWQVVSAIRQVRSLWQLKHQQKLTLYVQAADVIIWDPWKLELLHLAGVEHIAIMIDTLAKSPRAAVSHQRFHGYILCQGLIDITTEQQRISKDLLRLQKISANHQAKLGRADFIQGAPAEIVESTRLKLQQCNQQIEQLQLQRQLLQD